MRVTGIIIKDGKILLIRRIKDGEEYFVFPGGNMEEGEKEEETLAREIKEELNLDVINYQKVFQIINRGVEEVYYLATEFKGNVELGGPEKERMSEQNQYYPEWFGLIKASELKNLFPREAITELRRLPETHPNPDYYKAIPKKRMAAGVLIFNEKDQILLVKPSYKNHWSIPGGVANADESPRQTIIRETKEEINIDLSLCQFLCLEYISATKEIDENLQFIFYGGVLDNEKMQNIKIDKDEISDYRFVDTDKAVELLGGTGRKLAKRLPKCFEALKNKTTVYLENSESAY